jgi:hypothetical protein
MAIEQQDRSEQPEEQVKASESTDDLSVKLGKQRDFLTKESEKLGVNVDKPQDPEDLSKYESAQEAGKKLKDNPILKDALEKEGKKAVDYMEAFAQLDPNSIVSEKTEPSPEEIIKNEEEIKYLTAHSEEIALDSPPLNI